jgi:uncharacterized protein (DUF983 family)
VANESPMNHLTKGGWVRNWSGAFWALLRQRCPRCRRGRMFHGLLAMYDPCPVCGLLFQREEGSFLGAMYVSYVLSSAITAVLYFAVAAMVSNWNGALTAGIAILLYVPFVPLVFRYSRTVWIHLDRANDFTAELAGPYEKARLRELAAQADATTPLFSNCVSAPAQLECQVRNRPGPTPSVQQEPLP